MFLSIRSFVFGIAILFVMTACGGSSSSSDDDEPADIQFEVTTVAGDGTRAFLNGIGTAAQLAAPTDITVAGDTLYVADFLNHRIRSISLSDFTVNNLSGLGIAAWLDGPAGSAQFNEPRGLTTDGVNLYVADTENNRIRQVVIATGAATTLAGDGNAAWLDATGTTAQFNRPVGITTDGINLYVSEWGNHRIRQIVIATGVVTTISGDGNAGFQDGAGATAQFDRPSGIVTDGTNLYVADLDNRRIRQIVIATGMVTTFAGSSTPGSDDGLGTAATFFNPAGIEINNNTLYVSDGEGSKIRTIGLPGGEVTTIAGSGIRGYQDGAGSIAQFSEAFGMALVNNFLYIADTSNDRIRRVDLR